MILPSEEQHIQEDEGGYPKQLNEANEEEDDFYWFLTSHSEEFDTALNLQYESVLIGDRF
jgi:hypothetical protein